MTDAAPTTNAPPYHFFYRPHASQAQAVSSREGHDRILRGVVVGERLQLSDTFEEHLIVRLGNVLRSASGRETIEFIRHPLTREE